MPWMARLACGSLRDVTVPEGRGTSPSLSFGLDRTCGGRVRPEAGDIEGRAARWQQLEASG
jgi:hypothetical protein